MRRCLALAALLVGADAAYTPAFLWSEKLDAGVGRTAEHHGEVSAADLSRAVEAILVEGAAVSPLVHKAPAARPEVQLVFSAAELSTEAVREHAAELTHVEALLRDSASSVSMPFTAGAPHDGSVFDTAVRVPSHKAEEYLAAHPELFSNKVADVLIIELPAAPHASVRETLASQDKFVGKISAIVSKATDGKYAALLTGASAVLGGRRRLQAGEAVEGLHITADLYTALAVSLFLLIIFFSGFCCLFSLQTPRKFDDAAKILGTHAHHS